MSETDNPLSDKKLVFFFTAGMSVKKWSEGGMLSREVMLYNELAEHFEKIYFLTYGGDEEREYKNTLAPNIELLCNRWRMPTLIYSFLAPFIHRKGLKNADIYKTNQMRGSWTAVIAKLLFRKRLIVRQGYQYSTTLKKKDNYFLGFIASIIESVAYKNADVVVVTSQSIKEFIRGRYKTEEEKIAVIPNYVDTKVFKPIEIERDEKRVVFVGRLDREKNLFSLVDAVKGLDVELVLIGEGLLGDALKRKVKEEKIENVVFAGIIPNEELPEKLNKSAIFVQPSLYEGNPKTLLEAMACGLPVIGTDVVGINEVVRHKQNGYLCGTSTGTIRKAVREVLKDKKLQKELGVYARRIIVEDYSLQTLVKRELAWMEAVVEGC